MASPSSPSVCVCFKGPGGVCNVSRVLLSGHKGNPSVVDTVFTITRNITQLSYRKVRTCPHVCIRTHSLRKCHESVCVYSYFIRTLTCPSFQRVICLSVLCRRLHSRLYPFTLSRGFCYWFLSPCASPRLTVSLDVAAQLRHTP